MQNEKTILTTADIVTTCEECGARAVVVIPTEFRIHALKGKTHMCDIQFGGCGKSETR